MFAMGRQRVADVELEGEKAVISEVRETKQLGI
jgi:hypothetical protein